MADNTNIKRLNINYARNQFHLIYMECLTIISIKYANYTNTYMHKWCTRKTQISSKYFPSLDSTKTMLRSDSNKTFRSDALKNSYLQRHKKRPHINTPHSSFGARTHNTISSPSSVLPNPPKSHLYMFNFNYYV